MIISHSIYMNEKIVDYETSENYLYLMTDAGGRFSIPLGMLGDFREPYAPDNRAELLILHDRPIVDAVDVTSAQLIVHFADGRSISAPLTWFPRLLYGTPDERNDVEVLHGDLLHWEALDEDIEALTLFKMVGPSAESAESFRRWIAKRAQGPEQSASSSEIVFGPQRMARAGAAVREMNEPVYHAKQDENPSEDGEAPRKHGTT